MKYVSTLLAVKDIDRSVEFYKAVLGLHVVADFGANKTLTGGLNLQTLDSWEAFIGKDEGDVTFNNNASQVYFTEDDFDGFINKLDTLDVNYVHKAVEHNWGQRCVRFYDLDGHIIEVGETLNAVAKRFAASGLTVEQIAARMDVPLSYAKKLLK